MIGLGLSLTTRAVLGLSFNPATLFAAGEQGILIDPSDLSTLFTDTAGTTPVTAPGQTVALALDKSGRGNHLTQSVAAARPIYGRHPAGGIRNLLAATEDFADTYWTKFTATVSANAAISPIGAANADTVTATGDWAVFRTYSGAVIGQEYTFSVWIKVPSPRSVQLLLDGSFLVVNATTEWQRFSITKTAANTSFTAGVRRNTTGAESGLVTDVWGAQLEVGSAATAYQRVGAPSGLAFPQPQSYDITEAGVPNVHYLFCDGLARWMVSPTITPGTDKAQVIAGVRKLSDAAGGAIAELGTDLNTINGSFFLVYPRSAALNEPLSGYRASTGIVLAGNNSTAFTAPISSVITQSMDFAGPLIAQRVNGSLRVQNASSAGTGNYTAQQIFVGARNGTSLFFNGLIYSLVVRFGPNLPLSTIQQVERWTAQRTGVTLP